MLLVLAAEVSAALLVVMRVVGEKEEVPTASTVEAKRPVVVSGLMLEVSQSLSVPKSYP